MTRYPFRHASKAFLVEYRHVYAQSTYEERERRLRRMATDIEQLYSDGKMSTTDPAKMTYDDVKAFYALLKGRGLNPGGLNPELCMLNNICQYYGNGCVETARHRFPQLRGFKSRKRLPTIPYDIIDKILEFGLGKEGFYNLRNYAVVTLSVCAGLRTLEIDNALRDNIDLEEGTIYIDIVKGRGTYGEPRCVPIQPGGIPLLRKYVKVRDAFVPESDYLFPSELHLRPLATNSLRKFKDVVAEEVGYAFSFQAGRRTYGQWLIDDGVPAETVSLHMGHTTSKTTETFYARQRESVALGITKNIWKEKGRIE